MCNGKATKNKTYSNCFDCKTCYYLTQSLLGISYYNLLESFWIQLRPIIVFVLTSYLKLFIDVHSVQYLNNEVDSMHVVMHHWCRNLQTAISK